MSPLAIANLAMLPVSIGIIVWFVIRVNKKNKKK